ncbi:TPA: hypothetical protein ACKR34_006136, partial [Pseudomonas aeruginosa]
MNELLNDFAADGADAKLVVLAVEELVAIVEVHGEGEVGGALRPIVLSTSPGRLLNRETAPDLSSRSAGG